MTESEPSLPKHSLSYEAYFNALNEEIKKIYAIAEAARSEGYDPSTKVEIPPAYDVAARVEATLEGPPGVAERIRELQKDLPREEVAFEIAKEIAQGKLGGIEDQEKAADKAVRVALAILTESITAAPLEGIADVKIRGSGNDKYLALYLAGPIRAAGGTEAALTVLVADYVRQVQGLPPFKPTDGEIERALEEVELYARAVHLQYPVNPELIDFAASQLPIMLTGPPTEEFEVSGSRDLERIETNRVRGGAVLVLNDGVVGRAAKLSKIVNRMQIQGWRWLNELAEKISKTKGSKKDTSKETSLAPNHDYLADVIGGRPVFSHPSRTGGFRLRYGRSRNTGLAGVGIHPATMFIVDEFLAPGTHIRTERPGKGSIVAPVDTIEGPIVLLKDGTVKQINDGQEARQLNGHIDRILYLGDILVALGEFLENNHPLVPSGYCEEWWSHDLDAAWGKLDSTKISSILSDLKYESHDIELFIQSPLKNHPSPASAVKLSLLLEIPLHPKYLYRWNAISADELVNLRESILSTYNSTTNAEEGLTLPNDSIFKQSLEKLGAPHSYTKDRTGIVLTDAPETILAQLGNEESSIEIEGSSSLSLLNKVSKVELRDKIGFSIGARMGRPEKAEIRRMRPAVHCLFPVGRSAGTERQISEVAKSMEHIPTITSFEEDFAQPLSSGKSKGINVELVTRKCPACAFETFESRCLQCGIHTEVLRWCSHESCGMPIESGANMCQFKHDVNLIRSTKILSIDINALIERIKAELDEPHTHAVRGVLGLTSNHRIPEYLGKGVLRAKHDVYCYRDGTARFDATDAPLTHFTPREIGVGVEKLRHLGYSVDYMGNQLISEDQILELRVQDLVVPENCAEYLVRVGRFVDDCLVKIYHKSAYYNFRFQEDIIGQLVIGLAPHTSAGIIGRIIGFTTASVCYAHPYWHAAKRRNCDGDEDALILVLDALLNFSKAYLPAGRGGFMDAPLVLSVILNPGEVDDESHNLEVCNRYPAEFYEHAAKASHPRVVEKLVDIVASRLNTEAQYEGFGFTHGTASINAGPKNTRYKILGSMIEKLESQLNLAELISAVDTQDVAERVLSHHFIRDIRGNLRAYATQKIQCRKCNRIYRRIPLSGHCVCGNPLSLTVSQRNISKYLETSRKLIVNHGLSEYLKQRLDLIDSTLKSLFVSEQTTLDEYM